jgi:hypothetical protein
MKMVCMGHDILVAFAIDNYHDQGTYTKIFLQFPQKFWFDTQASTQMFGHKSG